MTPMTPTTHSVTMDTPDGVFTILLDSLLDAGSVLASGWTDDIGALVALVHPTLRPELGAVEPVSAGGGDGIGDDAGNNAVRAVSAYYDGDLDAPSRVPVRQHSGEFRMQAWEALRQVSAGERITYSEYAARAQRPAAVRAAAGACALNAAALFVPCHRVLRADGGLGGFRYGTEIKQRLLDRESPDGGGSALF